MIAAEQSGSGTDDGLTKYDGIPSLVKENILHKYSISVFPNTANDSLKIGQSEANICYVK
ncbi:MAG TPA: hypothetical protein DCW42_04400 [Bacteroidetes bacterium]|nr:hypothetical protein [Bacteroidota bacterium]